MASPEDNNDINCHISFDKASVEEITGQTIPDDLWPQLKEFMEGTLEDHYLDISKEVLCSYIGGDDDILQKLKDGEEI